MATCLEVISRAYQKLGNLALGTTLDPTREAIGLDALKSLYLRLVTGGGLGRARTVYVDGNYTAQEGDRIFKTGSPTITIPGNYEITYQADTGYTVEPGSGASTDLRAPNDTAFVIVTDGSTTATSLYDAYLGAWTVLETLVGADDAPLSRDKEALASALAVGLSGDTETALTPSIQLEATAFYFAVNHRFGSPAQEVEHSYY